MIEPGKAGAVVRRAAVVRPAAAEELGEAATLFDTHLSLTLAGGPGAAPESQDP
ncbi:MAG: hypothetical protein H0T50_06430 [Gemmatimonadales bacterium]|nr:hypothetical protein [Gemmatimonadales bacterium]